MATGCFADVVWCDLHAITERVGRIPNISEMRTASLKLPS